VRVCVCVCLCADAIRPDQPQHSRIPLSLIRDHTMPSHGPPSPNVQPAKRQRQSSFDDPSPRDGQTSPSDQLSEAASAGAGSQAAKSGQSSNFRNVSACNRCRLRKNRCDQRLPSCASCAKAGVACVGYDPITKKEIPRRYASLRTVGICGGVEDLG
jgi:hypothetical protein